MTPRVSVVIPAYNEAALLPETLRALRALSDVDELVVVDDGSTDDTADAAEGPDTFVLRLRHNVGKGGALEAGVDAARGDVLVFLDADLGVSAGEATALIEPVCRDEADLVIGCFAAREPAGFGLVQAVARGGIRLLTGLEVASPLSGQRAFHRRVLHSVPRFARRFGAEVAFTIDAVRAGWRVLEVSVAMTHAETQRDVAGFVHRGGQLWDVGKALLPRALRRGRRFAHTLPDGTDEQ